MRSSHFALVACLVILASIVFATTTTDGYTTTFTATGPSTYEYEGFTFESQHGLYDSINDYPECDENEDKLIYYGLSHEFQYGQETKKIRVYGCNFSMGENFVLEGIYLHDQLCTQEKGGDDDEKKNYISCTTSPNTTIHGIGPIKFRFVAPGFGINFVIKEQYTYHNPILKYVSPYAIPKADGVTVRIALEDYFEPVDGYEYSISINGIYATTLQQAQGYLLASIDLLKNNEKNDDSGTVRLHLFDGRETETIIGEFPNTLAIYDVDAESPTYVTNIEPQWIPLDTRPDEPFVVTVYGNNLDKVTEMHIYNDYTQTSLIFKRKVTTLSEEEIQQLEDDDLLDSATPQDLLNNDAILEAAGDLLEDPYDLIEGEDGIVFEIPVIKGFPAGPIVVEFFTSVKTITDSDDDIVTDVDDEVEYVAMGEITLIDLPTYVETRPTNEIFRGEKVVVEYYVNKFPHHVPTRINFAKVAVLQPGEFLHHREDYIYFDLPKCDDTTQCGDNYSHRVCLESLNTPGCAVDLGKFTYLPQRKSTTPMVMLATNQTKYFNENRRYHIIYGYNFYNDDAKKTFHDLRFVNDGVNRDVIDSKHMEIVPRTKNSLYIRVNHLCAKLGECQPGNYKLNLVDEANKTINTWAEDEKVVIEMSYIPGEAVRAKLLFNLDYSQIINEEDQQKKLYSDVGFALLSTLQDYVSLGLSERFLVTREIFKGKEITLEKSHFEQFNDGEMIDVDDVLSASYLTVDGFGYQAVTFPSTVVEVILAPAPIYPGQEEERNNASASVLHKHLTRLIQKKDSELYEELPTLNNVLVNHEFEEKLHYCHRKKGYMTAKECNKEDIDYKIIIFILIAGALLTVVVVIVLYLIIKGKKKPSDNTNIQDVYTQLDH